MDERKALATMLIIGGVILLLFGLMFLAIGKIPGDILVRKGNFTFFFPIVTSIVLSLILTILFNIFSRR